MAKRKQTLITTEITGDNLFEKVVQSLRPLAKHYSISSNNRVKIHLSDTTDPAQLDNAIAWSGGLAERHGGIVFVSFNITNEDAVAIVARVFGADE
jgi:hypothetical protein